MVQIQCWGLPAGRLGRGAGKGMACAQVPPSSGRFGSHCWMQFLVVEFNQMKVDWVTIEKLKKLKCLLSSLFVTVIITIIITIIIIIIAIIIIIIILSKVRMLP